MPSPWLRVAKSVGAHAIIDFDPLAAAPATLAHAYEVWPPSYKVFFLAAMSA
jgi:hypothetical protein